MSLADPKHIFEPGDEYEINGLRFRVILGTKRTEEGVDLVLQVHGDKGWQHVKMELGFFLADFFFENEERLYPQKNGNKGGNLYLEACKRAAKNGWTFASSVLESERRLKNVAPAQSQIPYDWEREGVFE